MGIEEKINGTDSLRLVGESPFLHSICSSRQHSNRSWQHLEPVWDSDSLDWQDLSAPEITKRVTGKVQPGSIVLFHNAALHTPEALPGIIETLLQDGYTFVPISEIILPQPYTIDHTGRQLPA